MMDLSDNLKQFIKTNKWIFAKTYAKTWPHEYIVQENVNNDSFLELANHIDTNGYPENFYNDIVIYFDYNTHIYWHMGNIINRCLERNTYLRREMDGRLPYIKNPDII